MAWLQNLAGKAEDFLNKIDQNAATVLSETNLKNIDVFEDKNKSLNVIEPLQNWNASGNKESENVTESLTEKTNELTRISTQSTNEESIKDNVSVASERSKNSETEDVGILLTLNNSRDSNSPFENISESRIFDKDYSTLPTTSESLPNCNSQVAEEIQIKYEENLKKLQNETSEMNKDLLNLRHLYNELLNENSQLKTQLERSNEYAAIAQNEMEQYKIRAQRILQEKEKLINLKNNNSSNNCECNHNVINTYNEELKKELQFQQDKNRELEEKLNDANIEINLIKQEVLLLQASLNEKSQTFHNQLSNEKKYRIVAEEECKIKMKELQTALFQISELKIQIQQKNKEYNELKEKLKTRNSIASNNEMEERLQALTQTLMFKQNNLETVTTERNALQLQLERLEEEHKKLQQKQRTNTFVTNIDDSCDMRVNVPKLMEITPFDIGVTKRVKQTYSTLDAISIRTGVFLRRYPLARIFLFLYMILLHLWVLLILFAYVPSIR